MSVKKILFTDIDDTLLNRKKEVLPDVERALKAAADAGHSIVISTGRPLAGILNTMKKLPIPTKNCYVITYNGALIYDIENEIPLFHTGLTRDEARHILDAADAHGIFSQAYDRTSVIARRDGEEIRAYAKRLGMDWRIDPDIPDSLPEDTIKVLLIEQNDKEKLIRIRDELTPWARGRISIFFSSDSLLEFIRDGVSKGFAVRFLAEKLGVPIENTVSAGDAENDIPMIEAAGIGCAMANAQPDVKAVADYVTVRDCEEGGLAEIIDRFILS